MGAFEDGPSWSGGRLERLAFLVISLGLAACRGRDAEPGSDCVARPPRPGEERVCAVPGWPDRDVIVRVPSRAEAPRPLVLALHGGGGRKEGFDKSTCRDGVRGDPSCLSSVAEARGVILAIPDGSAHGRGRSWNDAPPGGGWKCPPACEEGVDDVAYLAAVVELVAGTSALDRGRIYATGLSNGGAMSHRLACEVDWIAGIAAVAGADRMALSGRCEPRRAVPILQIHGDADPVWPYQGGETKVRFLEGRYPAAPWAVTGGGGDVGWVARNGCEGDGKILPRPDREADATRLVERRWTACRDGAEVAFVTVEGGGHTWPGGDAYLPERIVGKVSREASASVLVLDFLLRFERR